MCVCACVCGKGGGCLCIFLALKNCEALLKVPPASFNLVFLYTNAKK